MIYANFHVFAIILVEMYILLIGRTKGPAAINTSTILSVGLSHTTDHEASMYM